MFDLGGTYIRSAVAAHDGTLHDVQRALIPNVFSGEDSTLVWARIVDIVCGRAEGVQLPLDAIVMSFPGPVASRRIALAAPTIAGTEAPADVAAAISARTRLPVHLVNDVSAAAWHIGERIDADRFMVVTISSGIGSKLYDRASAIPVIDNTPYAGELGHVTVDMSPGAPLCDCGARGHLGAIASGRGAQRLARARAGSEPAAFEHSTCAQRYGATPQTLSNEEHLVPAARDCDEWARNVIRETIRPLALTLIAVVHASALERVVVIGGFAAALGDWYTKELESQMLDASGAAFGVPRKLVQGWDAGRDVCLEGAATFARALFAAAR